MTLDHTVSPTHASEEGRAVYKAIARLQTSMHGYLLRYLTAYDLPVRQDAVTATFDSLIGGEPPQHEVADLVRTYVEIFADNRLVIEPFKAAIVAKVLMLTAAGIGHEGMAIVRNLMRYGIRAMSLNTPVPEPHQLALILQQACGEIDGVVIKREHTCVASPSFLDNGRYHVLGGLGEGAFGVVWKARDSMLDRFVAAKCLVVDTNAPHTTGAKRMLRQEAQLLASFSHPHIVQVYDLVEEPPSLYMIMECVESGNLRHMLDSGAWFQLTPENRIAFMAQLCGAVEIAHSKCILHLDLKPENILTTTSGSSVIPKIGDFGISSIVRPSGTIPGRGQGTPLYMAPEQVARSGLPLSRATDVYSLAKVICECFSGQVGSIPDPTHEAIPESLRAVIWNCLRTNPDERIGNAGHLRKALEGAL